jgi:UDP-N-acetylglucosamine 3-dehydrogenase
VLSFRTTFKHPGPEGWSVDGHDSWFFDEKLAVMGVCGDLGVHKADLMRYLLDEEITEVCGFLATLDKKKHNGRPFRLDDTAFVTMKTESGALGSMTISWTNYGRFEDNGTTLFCKNGVMQIGGDREFGVVVNHHDGRVEKIRTGAIATNKKQVPSGIMNMFVGSILSGTPPMIDGEEGYKSLDVILSSIEAATTGKTVRVGKK